MAKQPKHPIGFSRYLTRRIPGVDTTTGDIVTILAHVPAREHKDARFKVAKHNGPSFWVYGPDLSAADPLARFA